MPTTTSASSVFDYEKLFVLDHDNGGMIYKVYHRQNPLTTFALKLLNPSNQSDPTIRRQVTREITVYPRASDSPHVLRCHSVLADHHSPTFLLEYMDAGTLESLLHRHNTIPSTTLPSISCQVLLCFSHLHSHQIVHRDIKPFRSTTSVNLVKQHPQHQRTFRNPLSYSLLHTSFPTTLHIQRFETSPPQHKYTKRTAWIRSIPQKRNILEAAENTTAPYLTPTSSSILRFEFLLISFHGSTAALPQRSSDFVGSVCVEKAGVLNMSVVGFDLGNESCIVAVARQRGIDVVLNDESKRETPAVVCFGEKQRFIGTAGAASSVMNPKNSISQIKRLLGCKFSDPEVQSDLKALPYVVTEGPDGYPLIHVRYLGEQQAFTPTQILGMILSNLKSIAEKNLNAAVVDCCIGIPVYFTDLQRRAVMDASAIAGLNPLRLFHETTATTLAYGIYKTDLPENDPVNVAFVDVGHASMQVCIAAYKKGQLKVLAHAFDRSLGGRDFDEVLFQHFAAKFKVEYKIDVFQNARATIRLRTACEKLKKMLSANPEAPINIECLMDEIDVRGLMKREEFEQISTSILQRVRGPLEKALADAGLTVDNIHTVEVVGSGSRVPAVIKILTEFFGKEPRRTMNASECVARGCALQCAILSPTFKVREFQVHESFPFSVALSWKGTASESSDVAVGNQQTTVVFPKGNPIPSIKASTFFRSGTFSVDVVYADASELQAPAEISTYMIGPFQSAKGERAKLKVRVRLSLHGIASIESATLVEEEEVEVPVSVSQDPVKEGTKMETDELPTEAGPAACDVSMQEAKNPDASSSGVNNGGAPDAEAKPEDKPLPMETDAKVEVPKKKVKKTIIPVSEQVYGGLPATELEKAKEHEYKMAFQDRVMEETKDRKNAVEAYVYDMRNKLHEKYHDFVTDEDREALSTKLQEVEDWLYEDGEDETKGVYIAKLEELKKQGDPIEERYKENFERGPAMERLSHCIRSYMEAALSKDPCYDHIESTEKEKVVKECIAAETWLNEKKQLQDALPKSASPVLMTHDLRKKTEVVDRLCRPIMTKPKPPPPKPQTPPPAETPASPQPAEQSESAGTDENMGATDGTKGTTTEPMETDKPETSPDPLT